MRTIVFCLGLALLPAPASAQRVVGRVLQSGTDSAVANVALRLEAGGRLVASAVTDSLGRFTLRANAAGRYLVSTSHIAYAPVRTEVELAPTDQLDLVIRLAVAPTELPPVVVVARSRAPDPHLERMGFYERKAEGFGVFRSPEEIEKRRPLATSDLFLSVNGVRVNYAGIKGKDVIMTRGEDPNCKPRILIDNVVVRYGGRRSRVDDPPLDALIDPHLIAGIEIYRSPSETPKQFSSPDLTCGVVLIWTQRGRR